MPQPAHRRFLHPRHWPTWLGLGLLWLARNRGPRGRRRIGRHLGALVRVLLPARRRVVATNLALAFPEKDPAERKALMHANYRETGTALLEGATAWWGRDAAIGAVRFEGWEHVERAAATGRGILLIGSHFVALEMSGRIFARRMPTSVVYKPARNRLFDAVMYRARARRFANVIRNTDLRTLVRELKAGRVVWYAPDQDMGRRQSVFAPFMGVPAATLTTTTRILRMTGATPLGYFPVREPDGYRIVITEMPGMTGADAQADAEAMNARISAMIREHPEQYFWLHRRFKTRPKGEPRIYR